MVSDLVSLLSGKPDLTNALATVVMAGISLAALFASFISLFVSLRALKLQQKHNVLSVRPLASILFGDYDNCLSVSVRNNGSGPMIIKEFNVKKDVSVKDNVLDWMPNLPEGLAWDAYAKELVERSLRSGGEIMLLKLSGKKEDPEFCQVRDKCRKVLAKLTIEVSYVDIYDRQMPPAVRALSWFGRMV